MSMSENKLKKKKKKIDLPYLHFTDWQVTLNNYF